MVNLQKSGDSAVKIVFTDSDHYLYGNGEVEVPVNSLLLVIDESEMVTFKKLSGDPFLSFRADNSNLGTKAAIEQFYKDNMVGSSGGDGSGVTPSEVQTMIDNSLEDYYTDDEVDAALSGKASISDVTAVANDVQTVSGQVQTKVATSDFNAYSAATATALGNKQDALVYYSEDTENKSANIHIENTENATYGSLGVDDQSVSMFVSGAEQNEGSTMVQNNGINVTPFEASINYDQSIDDEPTTNSYVSVGETVGLGVQSDVDPQPYSHLNVNKGDISLEVRSDEDHITTFAVINSAVTINDERVLTEGDVTSSITSGSTDSEIPTAKAVYDAIQAGGGGGAGLDDDTQQLISTAFNDLNDRKADLTELSKYQKKGDYVKTSTFAETLSDYMTNDAFDEYATAKERIISGALNDLNDKFGGLRLVKISQSEYDALPTKSNDTLYIINNVI